MAALSAITPTNVGAASAGAAVASTDTIALGVMGPQGVYLEVLNGSGSTDNITVTDPGVTASGNALTGGTYAVSVAAGASKVFWIKRTQANPATGLVTVTHSVTTTVTYKMYPVE